MAITLGGFPSLIGMICFTRARPQLLEAWRKGGGADPSTAALLPAEISGYQPTFERLFAQIYARPEICLGEYFNEVMLQHIPDYAYGEPVAVALETTESRISLSRSYAAFRDRLIELDVPWDFLKTARLERDIVRRCEAIADKLRQGAVEEAIRLGFALIEHKPPQSLFERSANAILDVARVAYRRNSAAASTFIRQGTQLALDASEIDPSTLGQVLLDAGKVSQDFGDLPLATELLQASHKRFSACFGAEHPATLMVMNQLASALHARGDIDEARVLYEKALEVRRRVLGDEHPDTLESTNNLALTLWDQGDLDGARAMQEKALELSRRILGEEHTYTLTSMDNLALILWSQGDLARARALQEHVLAKYREVLGEQHPDTLRSMANLAELLGAQGDLARARALQEHVLAKYREVLGEQHPDTLRSMANLAELLGAQGDLARARALQEHVLAKYREVLGEQHPDTLRSMANLAVIARAQGRLEEARVMGERVLHLRIGVLGDTHPSTVELMRDLGETLKRLGDTERALDLLTRAFDKQAKGQSRSEG